MYSGRLNTLTHAFKAAQKSNENYSYMRNKLRDTELKMQYAMGVNSGLSFLDTIIATQENEWQSAILRKLESEILSALSFVYPSDGYSVKLSARVLRGKVHIESNIGSYFLGEISGDVASTQGRLFQQVVSFAALLCVMDILGIQTIYVDEAFSGVAKANIPKINALLKSYQERGFNLIIIAQDVAMATGIESNTLLLSRSTDNKTSIVQERR